MEKAQLRRELKKTRNALAPEYVQLCSSKIAEYVLSSKIYRQSEKIMGYLSFGKEISVDKILRQALADGKTVYVPFVLTSDKMTAARIFDFESFQLDRYGIRTVAEPYESISPAMLDLILVPGVAFDKKGNRMGMGAGYYDRYLLQAVHAVTCGITCTILVQDKLPYDANDIPVSVLATEQGISELSIIKSIKGE